MVQFPNVITEEEYFRTLEFFKNDIERLEKAAKILAAITKGETMKIVAFGYKKNSGKDTAAKFLNTFLRCEYPQLEAKHISFAAKLKDISYQLYKWAGLKPGIFYELHRREKEIILPKLCLTPREIWINVGNKMREVYPMTWINYALKGVKADVIIISDLRFKNEANAVQEANGLLVKINRPNIPQGIDPAEIDLDAWTDWDFIINNNSSLGDLNSEIEKLASLLMEK